ncbi:pyridoxal phosphate-dependent aminotransferase [Convivina praedatoris]|uniref:Aminotransferase n=1 Tax=Convivina praedatoris TaxID=2880963 RepID=A0ABN8H9B7_9LACO|nr:pyridoxal phosphate-dependent aminotransferase [Convivina sp. LMG 32447]CAH1853430.1 Asparagine--oxo-acid transaminase [Convivina sp. LMG 32447]CAH1854826.1 Asparagine--oxo-acid transaminase [Convivina sp. LMG 32447]CAH1854982.1 Asparagine--oxo-acid transaminase [Convivina sp. LMG 32447]
MDYQFSKRVNAVTPSPTLMVSRKAKEMQAQGIDVINLGMGEPDFPTPPHIDAAAIQAIQANKTSFYTAVSGIPALKEAIADRMNLRYGSKVGADNVTVTTGAKLSLYVLMQVLLDPEDWVVTARPQWVSYVEQVKLAGGHFHSILPDNLSLKLTLADLEALDHPVKVLILNSPTNPTGQVYTRQELAGILNWANQIGTYVILDEIYGQLVYNGATFTSGLELQELNDSRMIIVDGVSKAYSMTGWRIGWTLADPRIIGAMNKILGHMTSNPSAVSQYAALAALTDSQDCVEEMRQTFEQRLNATYAQLEEMSFFNLPAKPQGAFYLFPQINPQCMVELGFDSTSELVQAILTQSHVALPSGEGFGMPGYLRISYAKDQATLDQALSRLKNFFNSK